MVAHGRVSFNQNRTLPRRNPLRFKFCNVARDTIKKVEEALDGISDTVKTFDGVLNKVNAVKMVLDKVPGQQPASPAAETTGDSLQEVAKDPVNEYVKEEI